MAMANMNEFLRQVTRDSAGPAPGDAADSQLVARALFGDSDAFQAILHRHGAMVYRVCWRVAQHPQDAEDAFQATFLILARKLHTVQKQASLASWLHGVARRVALKAQAQAANRRQREQRLAPADAAPADDLTWSEMRSVLDFELTQIPDRWRLPLILCYLEGRTQEEAARQLGWSKSTLRRRLEEARAALGARLQKRGIAWSAALSAVLLSDSVTAATPPIGLIAATIDAWASVAAGKTLGAVVSANVDALANEVMNLMLRNKIKVATMALVCTLLCLGFALAGIRSLLRGDDKVTQGKQGEAPPSQPAKDLMDTQVLQGKWVLNGGRANGQNLPESNRGHVHLIVIADEMILYSGNGQSSRFVYKLDTKATPHLIDLDGIDGRDKGKKLLGIAALTGDQLKVCRTLNATTERPKEYSAEAGSKCVIEEWQREKDTYTVAEDRLRLAGRWRNAEKGAEATTRLRDLDFADHFLSVTYEEGDQQLGFNSGLWRVEEQAGVRKIIGPSGACTYRFDKGQLQVEFAEGRLKGKWTLAKARMP